MPRVAALVLFVILVAGEVLGRARPLAAPRLMSSSVRSTRAAATPASLRTASSSSSSAARPRSTSSSWTIKYASARGTDMAGDGADRVDCARAAVPRSVASAGAVGSPLPTPDATGTTNLAVSGG